MDCSDPGSTYEDLQDPLCVMAPPCTLIRPQSATKKQCIRIQNFQNVDSGVCFKQRKTLAIAHLYLREASFSHRCNGKIDSCQETLAHEPVMCPEQDVKHCTANTALDVCTDCKSMSSHNDNLEQARFMSPTDRTTSNRELDFNIKVPEREIQFSKKILNHSKSK